MGVMTKRSSMTFYSDGASQYSHRVRIVLAEKGVSVEIISASPNDIPEQVTELNPYNNLPMLLDRGLALYESKVMMEYLDERFPHPPLFPVYPVARAHSRLWIYRIRRDWCYLVDSLVDEKGTPSQQDKMRKELRESIISIAPIFGEKPFFMSDDFTIVDCCVCPILWRLPMMGIQLPNNKSMKPLLNYRDRLFERESIMDSLSEKEKDMM